MTLPWKFRITQAWEVLVHGTDTRHDEAIQCLFQEGMRSTHLEEVIKESIRNHRTSCPCPRCTAVIPQPDWRALHL